MNYLTVAETAEKWGISVQMVRRYCIQDRIPGAYLENESWFIPELAEKPAKEKVEHRERKIQEKPQPPLVKKLRQQKTKKMYHGLYEILLA